jgi:DNA mismatch repair protein MSH3
MTTPKASQGKRKSGSQPSLISNYFKRIDSPATTKTPSRHDNDSNTTPSKPPPPPESAITATSDGEHERDDTERTSKRPRLATPPESAESWRPVTPPSPSERNALTALMSPKIKEFRPPPESPRTARYRYAGPGGANTEEPATPEQAVKRKTLHEKFVAKLGRPESLALLRRKSASDRGDEEGEEEDEDEDEEESSVAAKSLRGKYVSTAYNGKKAAPASKKGIASSTAKFTPLERQYVEIKKKYPDTLLLIEVGYKFRFFGEDAKVPSRASQCVDQRLPPRNSE